MGKKIIPITILLILFNFSFCFADGILGDVLPINNKQLIGLVLFIILALVMMYFMGWLKYLLIGMIVLAMIAAIFFGILYYGGTSMQIINPP